MGQRLIEDALSALAHGVYPEGVTPLAVSSGNVANAAGVATLPAAEGKTTYITGFQISGAGATGALVVTVAITGLIGEATLSYTYTFVAGAAVANAPLIVTFPRPIPGNAANTAIVVTCPASGAGGLKNTVSAVGFQK